MVDFIASFKAFIEKIVKMIQDFVAKIREMNDKGWQDPDATAHVA